LALNEREQAAALEIEVEKGKKLYLLAEIRRDKTAAARLAQELAGRDIQVGQTLATLPREPLPPDPLAHLDFRQRQGKLPSPVSGRSSVTSAPSQRGIRHPDPFERDRHRHHLDSPVRAVAPGVVRYIGNLGYGRVLIVDHGARYHTLYGHLADFRRTPGDMVQTGDVIGTVGASGLYREPVLHFEIRYQGVAVNPMPWLAMTDH
jgi:septal ring factor EnvC (AmiA/AmiB activator)